MCDVCKRTVHGVIYCEDCLANRVNQPVGAFVPAPDAPSPALATLLGFIPGVGAMYNGQFYKGLIHVAIFAGLIGLESAGLPSGLDAVVGISIAFWYIYMIVDANRTATARLFGRPLPDPFGFERMFGGHTEAHPPAAGAVPGPGVAPAQPIPPPGFMPVQQGSYVAPPPEACNRGSSPIGAIVLIGLGVLFLLNQFGWWEFHWVGRMWPLILIALGVWLFIRRFGGHSNPEQP
jgi:TM2 domain-containing membrane protein YozV